jgi:hypothetical protein
MRTRELLTTAAALLIVVSPATAAPAGDAAQPDWSAWLGCWELMDGDAPAGQLVCMLPGADGWSVRIATVEDGAITDETLLHADGVARQVDEGGCTGTETAYFSRDERRVYTRAELDCRGVQRVSTGVLALISEVEWLDAQAMTVAGQSSVRTVRYRAVPRAAVPPAIAAALPSEQRLALEAARLDASAPLDVEDVIEAAGIIGAPALEALLGARQQGFSLDARRLAMLAERGVAPSTIDVMVALSYPSRFAVQERRDAGAGYGAAGVDRGGHVWDECRDPLLTSRRYRSACYGLGYGGMFGYDRYGYSRYGYSPWGYDRYGWQYGSGPIIIVHPGTGEPTSRGGTVEKGRGFMGGERPSTGRAAQPRSADRPQSSTGTSSGSKPASASTPTTSTGTSSTGRTAKPRTGGGGGGDGDSSQF